MSNLPAFTHIAEKVAYKLWPIVGPYKRGLVIRRAVTVHCFPKRLTGVLGLTGRSSVVADDDPGKYINYAQYEEMSIATRDVTVFNVHLPELVRSCNDTILWQFPRMLEALLTLWL
ncbi:hypothetical protein LOZ80_33460 [Paenibacillus sp. HWE-109]|nr:hypothetical protein [Paenibacillus sp. HWE-109]UKS26376.1 hypothetical protein LOZ80_33460 [Paenibacillus sp. HWE-109]